MSDAKEKLLISSIIGFFAGIYTFFKGFKTLKKKRLIENTPTSKIRSLAMGLVEIYGQTLPYENKLIFDQSTFKSPFTKTDCLYYRYTIEEYRKSKNNSSWVTIKQDSNCLPFLLDDQTGEVMIDIRNANIKITPFKIFHSNTGQEPPDSILDFLRTNGLSHEGFLGFSKKMRYTEYIIKPYDKIYILGTACDNPYIKDSTGLKNETDIIINKGKSKHPFIVSDKTEKDFLSSLGSRIFLEIFGGSFLTLISLAYILFYFNFF